MFSLHGVERGMRGVGRVEVGVGKMKREKEFGPRYDPCLFMYTKDYLVRIEFTQSKVECTLHYIILNNGILKSNSSKFPRSEGYITQYTP